MSLPLLARAPQDDGTFVHVAAPSRADRPINRDPSARVPNLCGLNAYDRMPDREPGPGEQYRFHVDMDACIGCKCCVVACNEQNGNPAEINWRRVAEVEVGVFPATTRGYLSMGCNHCVDPTCLAGCPVDAYSKDAATGIVRHSAETCIGCQYCTWTCSYGVPQFNVERRVVGKCDMCYGRLSAGQAPACVSACPEGAIAIEIVNVAEWRRAAAGAKAGAGMPQGDGSLSTTRVTASRDLPEGAQPNDLEIFRPQEAHGPLVVMLTLTQLAVGAFATIAAVALSGLAASLFLPAFVALNVTGLALAASTTHLGRPIHAYRAMRMWKRSWLSREVVLFGAFAKAAAGTTALLWFESPYAGWAAGVTALVGAAGILASARIYHVVSRPSWNTLRTEAEFFGTAFVLGPLFAAASGFPPPAVWPALAAAARSLLFVVAAVSDASREHHEVVELRGAYKLGRTSCRSLTDIRLAACATSLLLLPAAGSSPWVAGVALVLATAGELLGRYLFFVTAVPRHMTAAYTLAEREAA